MSFLSFVDKHAEGMFWFGMFVLAALVLMVSDIAAAFRRPKA